MVQVVRKVIIPGISERVIVRAIEVISDALIRDAKENFGSAPTFKTDLRISEQKGYVESFVQFWPYRYDFIWRVKAVPGGHEVTFDARTGGSWYEFLFDIKGKLLLLVNSQWSALLNFAMGYLTATAPKGHLKAPKKHIAAARARLRER
jgi:hypothetical protein